MPKVQAFDYIELMRFYLSVCKVFRHATKPKNTDTAAGDRKLYSATGAADCSE